MVAIPDRSRMMALTCSIARAASAAADVRTLADAVALEAESLETEVRRFLANVQAA